MRALDLILHVVIGATLAGAFVTVALVAGHARPLVLLGAATAGFVVAVPAAIAIRRALVAPRAPRHADNRIANKQ